MTQNNPVQDQAVTVRSPETGALAALSLAVLLSSLGTSIANVALPTLAEAFAAPFQQVQWVVLAYLLAVTALIVGVGRLGDIAGRRRLLLAGTALFAAASGACAAAGSLWLLVAARAVQGLGAAAMMALAMAMVGEIVPKARTGSAMGLLGSMSAVGTALGPSLGGLLIAGAGWRWIFLVNLPLGALAVVLAARFLPADRRMPVSDRPGFDWVGTLLLAATLAAYALAMTIGRGRFGPVNVALLVAAGVGVVLFLHAEKRAHAPLVRPAAFRNLALSAGLGTSLLVATVMMATLVVGPFYLSRALALDAAAVGAVTSAGPLVAALTGVPAGRVVDRFGAGRMAAAGLAGMVAGCAALALTQASVGVAGYVAPIVVMTASYALFQAANNTGVMAGAGPERKGVVSGLLNLARNLGLITGASAMGAVFAFGSGAADIAGAGPEAVAGGMRATFAVALVLVAAALGIVVAGRARAGRAAGLEGTP